MEVKEVWKWAKDFSLTFPLLKPLKFVWVYQVENFYGEKAYFTPGKKSGKVTLPPLKNIPVMPQFDPTNVLHSGQGLFWPNFDLHMPKLHTYTKLVVEL